MPELGNAPAQSSMWDWMVAEGLIAGDPKYYSSGKATAAEYEHAIKTAYNNATDENRQQLVDLLYETGLFGGSAEYWYQDRGAEVADLGKAAWKFAGEGATPGSGPRFSIAGGAELWKNTDTGQSFIVYEVPDSEPPMYIRYEVPSEGDLQSFFGPDQPIVYNREIDSASTEWTNSMGFGTSSAVANTSDNPFASWSETLTRAAETQPWLLDDDYQRLFAVAILEGRELDPHEIASTQWYQEHNEGQRAWMQKYHMDPLSAQQEMDSGRIIAAEYFRENGMNDIDQKLIDFMADKWTTGDWTQQELQWQAKVLTDPYFSGEAVNTELQAFIDDNSITMTSTRDDENEVRNLVQRWLGTNFGNWDDEQVGLWASRMRNETDAAEKLTEVLKDQRFALFPEYDREADYETIASPWRTVMRNMWGEVPNDSDSTLQNIIKMNDSVAAGQYLTKEGLARGNETVVNNVQGALARSFGGTAI